MQWVSRIPRYHPIYTGALGFVAAVEYGYSNARVNQDGVKTIEPFTALAYGTWGFMIGSTWLVSIPAFALRAALKD
jgi:hypothetical protein